MFDFNGGNTEYVVKNQCRVGEVYQHQGVAYNVISLKLCIQLVQEKVVDA
jgi:hypothetical protein